LPTGTLIGFAGVARPQAALQAVGRAQRDGAHHAVAQLLLHFQRDQTRCPAPSARHTPCGTDSRGNSTSTTAPMICTILPWLLMVVSSEI
jgi:hypothetical protein